MKHVHFLLLLMLPFLSIGQNNFSLNVKTENSNDKGKMYLVYEDNGNQRIENGVKIKDVFVFNTKLLEPSVAVLIYDHQGDKTIEEAFKIDALKLFIEPSALVAVTKDSIKKATINSPLNKDYVLYNSSLSTIENQLNDLNNNFQLLNSDEKNNQEKIAYFQQKYNQIIENRKYIVAKFITDNPKSYVSLYMLNAELGGQNLNYEVSQKLYNAIDESLQKTNLGKFIKTEIEKGKFTSIGSMAINFSEHSSEGKLINLSDFKGKYVLLDFWASWCGPCRQENPTVVKAYQKFKDKNFTVLGVSLDKDKSAWLKAIKDDLLEWTNVSDLNYFNGKVARLYQIESIPQNFLINPEGKIIAKNLRGFELELKLNEVLNK